MFGRHVEGERLVEVQPGPPEGYSQLNGSDANDDNDITHDGPRRSRINDDMKLVERRGDKTREVYTPRDLASTW